MASNGDFCSVVKTMLRSQKGNGGRNGEAILVIPWRRVLTRAQKSLKKHKQGGNLALKRQISVSPCPIREKPKSVGKPAWMNTKRFAPGQVGSLGVMVNQPGGGPPLGLIIAERTKIRNTPVLQNWASTALP